LVAASELRLERVAENADSAELKLWAMDCSALLAELEAEAITDAAEFEIEATDWETEEMELEIEEAVLLAVLPWASAGARRMDERMMLQICIVAVEGSRAVCVVT